MSELSSGLSRADLQVDLQPLINFTGRQIPPEATYLYRIAARRAQCAEGRTRELEQELAALRLRCQVLEEELGREGAPAHHCPKLSYGDCDGDE